MTLVLNGTTGVSAVDGSAATPAIQGNDTNTGIFFPAADTVAIATGGTERVRADSAGNVGIGTSSPSYKIHIVVPSADNALVIDNAGATGGNAPYLAFSGVNAGANYIRGRIRGAFPDATGGGLIFETGTSGSMSERARIDSSGNLVFVTRSGAGNTGQLQVGSTSALGSGVNAYGQFAGDSGTPYPLGVKGSSSSQGMIGFFDSANSVVGSISKSGSSVAYNTSSDYRLKEDVQPMVGALARVAALKPCTYKWKSDGFPGEGFIAHELQEVCPSAVTGEKDAIDAEGNIIPQGIDTSFLVATLTAAIQEQQAMIVALKAEVDALKGAQA